MRAKGWLGKLKALGTALVELLLAELATVGEDLRRSARELKSGLVLLVIGAFFAFWTVGALAYGAIEVLAIWLPRWGAVLAVGGSFALLTLLFLLLGRSRLRRLESPARMVGRRLGGHTAWVQEQLLGDPEQE